MKSYIESKYEINYVVNVPIDVLDLIKKRKTKEVLSRILDLKRAKTTKISDADLYRTIIINTDSYLTDKIDKNRDLLKKFGRTNNIDLDDTVYIQFLKFYIANEEYLKYDSSLILKQAIRFRTTEENYKIFFDISHVAGSNTAANYFSALICYFNSLSYYERLVILNYDMYKAIIGSLNTNKVIIIDNGRRQRKVCVYKQITRGKALMRNLLLLYDLDINKATICSLDFLLAHYVFRYETAKHVFLESEITELDKKYKDETEIITCDVKINCDTTTLKNARPFLYSSLNLGPDNIAKLKGTRRQIEFILLQFKDNYEILTTKYKDFFKVEKESTPTKE